MVTRRRLSQPTISEAAWLLANVAGVITFLKLASASWIEPELSNVPGASGGAFLVWGMTALPVFAVFTLANLLWAGMGLAEGLRRQRWTGEALALVVLAAWLAAFVFDGLHHGI